MIAVRQNGNVYPLRLSHWWPGRVCRLPNVIGGMWLRAVRQGTKYLTIASVELNGVTVTAHAMCRHDDQPRRKVGRFIALLRLARGLKSMGLRLESVE